MQHLQHLQHLRPWQPGRLRCPCRGAGTGAGTELTNWRFSWCVKDLFSEISSSSRKGVKLNFSKTWAGTQANVGYKTWVDQLIKLSRKPKNIKMIKLKPSWKCRHPSNVPTFKPDERISIRCDWLCSGDEWICCAAYNSQHPHKWPNFTQGATTNFESLKYPGTYLIYP